MRKKGFTLIEMLVVVAVIGIISGVVLISMGGALSSARDTRRKAELSQIRQIFVSNCFMPSGGPGEYDLIDVANELKAKYPQYANRIAAVPRDPRHSSGELSYYKYIISEDGKKCALYANLEKNSEKTTLNITEATPGGGTGVFQASESGWNGSDKFFQVSN